MWMRRTSKEKENSQSEKEIDRKIEQHLSRANSCRHGETDRIVHHTLSLIVMLT